MNITKAIKSLIAGCFATAASTGTPERARPTSRRVKILIAAIRYRKRAQVAEDLNAVLADALRNIECLTHDQGTELERVVHKVAGAWVKIGK